MIRGVAAGLLLLAGATGEDPPPLVLADFEDAADGDRIEAGNSEVERLPLPPPGTGTALRWTIPASEGASYLYVRIDAPPDLGRLRFLSMRIRIEGRRPGALWARLENGSGAWLGARLRGAGEEWTTVELPLEDMERDEEFDPAAVNRLDLVVFGSAGGVVHLDDLRLSAGAALAPSPEPGGKAAAKGPRRRLVADFEGAGSGDWVDGFRCGAERVPAGGKEKGSVLAWTLRGGDGSAYLEVYGMPRDVRAFRTLRFRIRSAKDLGEPVHVRLESTIEDVIGAEVAVGGPAWRTVELPLPELRPLGEFDPRRVQRLSFTCFKPPEAVVEIDDIVLEEGPGGWRLTEKEMLARTFGEDRLRKVRKIPTKHFDVFTDSTAAQGKFPKALEEAYDFVKATLGIPEMEEKLPVYIFQNPTLYAEFTVRSTGWTKEAAERTSGHGSGRYFATYYQSPDAPTVVHELTHSIFHRTTGFHGGSWFQEGVAVHVEHAWMKKSAAAEFAASLRGGQYVRLGEFTAIPSLVAEKDPKGGPRTADRLYLQAGAFFEFLVRGPHASKGREAIRKLARTPATDAEQAALLAKFMGMDLAALDREWVAWGSDTPKR
jgi:hypothetical protein